MNRHVPTTLTLGLGLILAGTGVVQAAKPLPEQPVPYFAGNCANCHGTQGKTQTGLTLAGRDANLLKELLLSYKNGTRQGTIMNQHAKGYTDEEIAILADYFSRQKN